jgi:Tol biopolymer transport system component
VNGVHAIPTLISGSSGFGETVVVGSGTSLDTGFAMVGAGGTGSLVVSDGASMAIGVLAIGGSAPVKARVVASGGGTISAGTLATFGTWLTPSDAQVRAEGEGSLITLPAVQIGAGATGGGSLVATNGGSIVCTGVSSQGSSQLVLEATAGGTIASTGPVALVGGAIQIGPDASSLAAPEVTTATASTTITLPLGSGVAISAQTVFLGGPLTIAGTAGWSPAAPGDLRLIAADTFAFSGQPSLPSYFGFPTLLLTDAEGAFLRILDHVDALTVPPTITLDVGESMAVPATITVDGETYDVSGQLLWEIANPFVISLVSQQSGQSVLKGIGPGTAEAVVHFGSVSATITLSVPGGGPFLFELLSGVGTTFGNNDSGATDPELFNTFDWVRPQALTDDGQCAIFTSFAGNLASGAAFPALYGRDAGGSAPSLLSGANGPWATANTYDGGTISSDGRYVVFPGGVSGQPSGLFILDRTSGVREPVGYAPDGIDLLSGGEPRVSDDGRFVLFASFDETSVPGDTNGVLDVFLRDRQNLTTTRVSLTTEGGQLAVASWPLDLTPDGRYAFFRRSMAGWDVAYRFDRETGTVDLATPGSDGLSPTADVLDAQVSEDGRFLSFRAQGSEHFVPGAPPIGAQVYRRDLITGDVIAVSASEDGAWPFAPIDGFAATGDARWYALTTRAANLSADAVADGRRKLYRRDTLNGVNRLLSVSDAGIFDADVDPSVAIAAGGTRILFASEASNVLPLDTGGHHDVFLVTAPIGPPEDLNGDGLVGPDDLAVLLGAWGTVGPGDLNGNGSVEAGDLAILLGAWAADP